jgi:hypothetical protein
MGAETLGRIELSDEICEAALDNFDRAFSHIRTRSFKCQCGKTYWDSVNLNDWDEGEREELAASPNCFGVAYAIDVIEFNGKEYANACECWKPKASQIIAWLEENRQEIATFFKLEKERIVSEANRLALVE